MSIFSRNMGRATLAGVAIAALAGGVAAQNYGNWSMPINAETGFAGSGSELNSSSTDGCPYLDPYTRDLFIASNRPGGYGGLDIWRARWNGNGWDDPENLGPTINTADNEFCPSPSRGNRLFFVRAPAGTNVGDIYQARKLPNRDYSSVSKLPDTINGPAAEWSPSYYEEENGDDVLYFSSTRDGTQDIFVSVNWGPAQKVAELSSDGAQEARPNVRRDGLEIVFDVSDGGPPDIYTSSRNSTSDPWDPAVPLTQANSPSGESRASFSWDGSMLVFGSARPGGDGGPDVYVLKRGRR